MAEDKYDGYLYRKDKTSLKYSVPSTQMQ